jgi:hypothetical protein
MARPRSGFAPRPGNPRTTAIRSAKTSTNASATTIMWMLIVKPDQMSGNTCLNANGSAKAWRRRCTAVAYFRIGMLATLIANHFCWSFPMVPACVSALIAAETSGVSFDPFAKTAPYFSFVTI